mmetsp:Transcript_51145/g.122490  ORF Transcript_51145/g.122490 Transcript_51145/m.122490 type:complete len:480 (-) Transcript_51145:2-1441(-)
MDQSQLEGWTRATAVQVLQVFLENSSTDSVQGFCSFALRNTLPDGTSLGSWSDQENFRHRILLAFAQWTSSKARQLDDHVPLQNHMPNVHCSTSLNNYVNQEHAGIADAAISEFIYHVAIRLLGPDAACFGNALGGFFARGGFSALRGDGTSSALSEYPALVLSDMVRYLEEIQAKVLKVAQELTPNELAGSLLMEFCHYFTVITTFSQQSQMLQFRLQAHENVDEAFQTSEFRIQLIDSCGSLMSMLQHIEQVYNRNQSLTVAVDFEGVDLCRTGELCLVQMTCDDDPTLVYVLDVHVLGQKTFHLATPTGMSMKYLLEDHQNVTKLWFDPRNDVDALYHQFGITPRNVMDLQLAEVAIRRSQGHVVKFVTGLQRCLQQSDQLSHDQVSCAQDIDNRAKSLFEPKFGGRYETFQERPLRDVILMYAAHDSRYMLLLYQYYIQKLTEEWYGRVLAGSSERAKWFQHTDYKRPGTDAPDF